MTLQTCLIAAVIVLLPFNQTRACLQINTSCPAIQTPNGFMFTYMIPEGSNISEIYVYHNKTTIAHAVPRKNKFEYLSDVESMGNTSVVTRDCKDLKALCILRNEPHIIEHCVDYKITVTGEMKMSDSSKLWGLTSGIAVAVVLLIGILCYLYWKKQRNSVASRHGCFGLTCFGHRGGISPAERGGGGVGGERGERGERGGGGGGGEGGERGETRLTLPDTEQHGDGKERTLLIPSQNHNLSTVVIPLSKNGYLSAPDVNGASNQALDRIMKDDPGGVSDTRGPCTGWSSERSGSQDYVNEEQQLLSNQRISVPDFDNEGEAERLVNKRNVDRFSRRSTVLDTDEESMTSSMKNHNTIKP